MKDGTVVACLRCKGSPKCPVCGGAGRMFLSRDGTQWEPMPDHPDTEFDPYNFHLGKRVNRRTGRSEE